VEGETHKEIEEFHEGVCGGNYSWNTTAHKILKVGFYWATLFGDVILELGCARNAKCFLKDKIFLLSP